MIYETSCHVSIEVYHDQPCFKYYVKIRVHNQGEVLLFPHLHTDEWIYIADSRGAGQCHTNQLEQTLREFIEEYF